MDRKIQKTALLILIISLCFSFSAGATSFYSSKGLGTITEGISAQGFAMGGIGISLLEGRALSNLNPASNLPAGITRLSVNLYSESISQSNDAGSGQSYYANALGGQFLVPIGKKYSFTIGAAPLFLTDYRYRSEGGTGETSHLNILSGKGSLNKAYMGFFANIKQRLSLGLSLNFAFGKYDEHWQIDYYSDYYHDTKDILHTKLSGFNLTTGMIANIFRTWNLGAVVSTPLHLKTEHTMTHNFTKKISEYSSDYAKSFLTAGELNLPLSWGVGSSVRLFKKKLILIGEYFNQPFSQTTTVEENMGTDSFDYHRFSLGLEYLPSTDPFSRYYRHIPLRAGFFYKQLPTKYVSTNPVKEYGLTFGLGFPFYFSMGRIDFGLALGKRGELTQNPVEEKFINFMVSITGGEKWFIRGKRK